MLSLKNSELPSQGANLLLKILDLLHQTKNVASQAERPGLLNLDCCGRAGHSKAGLPGLAIGTTTLLLTRVMGYKTAIRNRGSLKGYIHHTDSDVRYCSKAYIDLLESTGPEISMCVGDAYENAHSESFNTTLKRQEINLNEYQTKEESARSIFAFVQKYIAYRPHSALGGLTPAEYREKILAHL